MLTRVRGKYLDTLAGALLFFAVSSAIAAPPAKSPPPSKMSPSAIAQFKKNVQTAFNRLMNYPTGRAFLREFGMFPQSVEFEPYVPAMDHTAGTISFTEDKHNPVIRLKIDSTVEQIMMNLPHEFVHIKDFSPVDRESLFEGFDSRPLQEMATKVPACLNGKAFETCVGILGEAPMRTVLLTSFKSETSAYAINAQLAAEGVPWEPTSAQYRDEAFAKLSATTIDQFVYVAYVLSNWHYRLTPEGLLNLRKESDSYPSVFAIYQHYYPASFPKAIRGNGFRITGASTDQN